MNLIDRKLAALGLVALLAACSTEGDDGPSPGDGGRMAPLAIEEVLTLADGTPVLVKGSLLADNAGVRLCEAIGESFPPSCLGPSMAVLDLDRYPEYAGLLSGEGEVRMSEGEVTLVGYYSDGALTVDPGAAGADAS